MPPVMTTESTVRAAAQSAFGFIARVDPHSGIVILLRGRGRAAELAGALPDAIAGAATEHVPAEAGSETAAWPEPVRAVIAFLGAVHHDLRAERAYLGDEPNALDILVGLPAGDRLHVVAAGGVVGFRAHLGRWERLAPLGERARRPLGLDSKARIEVTSEPYALGDLVLAIPDVSAAAGIAVQPPLEIARAIASWAGAVPAPKPGPALGAYAVLGWAPAIEGPPPPAARPAPSIFELAPWKAPAPAAPAFSQPVFPPPPPPPPAIPRHSAASELAAVSKAIPEIESMPETPTISELEAMSELEAISELEAMSELDSLSELEAIPELEMLAESAPLPELADELEAPTIHDLAAIPELDAMEESTPTPSESTRGLLPDWLLERAAKDLAESSTTLHADPEFPIAAAPGLEPPLTLGGGKRRRPRKAILIGLGLAAAAGLASWRGGILGSFIAERNDRGAKPLAAGEEHPIDVATSGMPAPSMTDLLGGARPLKRVVPGQGGVERAGAAGAVAVGAGRIEARTEPYLPDVLVTIDGKPIGKAPVSLDGLPAGTHLVSFDGGNGRRWEEEVTVVEGDVAVAVAPLGAPATQGQVEVLATTMHDDGPADEEVKVLVDGDVRGATPLDLTLDPGVHWVALDLGGDRLVYRVIEVRPGDRQVLEVPIDVPPPFQIHHRPAASLAAEGTAILTVDVKGPAGTATYLDLRVEERGTFRSFPMGPLPGAPGTYAVGLPLSRERHGKQLRYYFATAAEGELPVVTKIFSVPLR